MTAEVAEDIGSGQDGTRSLLEVSELSMSFGETRALVSCSLAVGPGEIHAVVGENGSGKSTLVKILSGVLRPDRGCVRFVGSEARFHRPDAAQRAGVSTVFQETLVIEELSVVDNVFLGLDRLVRPGHSRTVERRRAREVLDALGMADTDLNEPLWRLSLGQRQLVTVARGLVRPWRLLILDEATSALDVGDRDRLFDLLARERDPDRSVLFISHRMDEIWRLADRITVLRSGESIATLAAAEASTEHLLRLMSGERGVALRTAAEGGSRATPKKPVLRVRGLVLREGASPVDLELGQGEILGVSGLEGQGQALFLESLVRLASPVAGAVEVPAEGRPVTIRNPHHAFRHGIAYLPRDRKTEGLLGSLSVLDNASISILPQFSRLGILRRGPLVRQVGQTLERLHTRMHGVSASIGELSGGNQQKILLARWIAARPQVLVLNDPLRGVDHASKAEIYEIFRDLSRSGVALVLLSTEIEELVLLASRIAVFREHSLVSLIERADISPDSIISAMFGHAKAEP